MKAMRLYRKGKDGEYHVAWKFVLGPDEMLEIDNLLEPDGPTEFVHQIDSHLVQIRGEAS